MHHCLTSSVAVLVLVTTALSYDILHTRVIYFSSNNWASWASWASWARSNTIQEF